LGFIVTDLVMSTTVRRYMVHSASDEPFTAATALANEKHDRRYGWNQRESKHYSNAFRLPEVHLASPIKDNEAIWEWIHKVSPIPGLLS